MSRLTIGLAGALALAAATGVRAQVPQKYTNLQILPKDTSPEQLVAMMKSFAQGLGVRCEHCHVGEGNDLSKFDFAADTKPAKATARKMIRIASTLNAEVATIVPPAADAPTALRVTCFTCHRGEKKPLTAPAGGGGAP
jgi:Photosynthetic reaction centre cytochrome C subunit